MEKEKEDMIESIMDDPEMQKRICINRVKNVERMSTNCNVYKFLQEGKRFAKYKEDTTKKVITQPANTWTHLIMSGEFGGGFKLDQTEENEREFLYNYARDIKNGVIHYIIEKRTTFFHFHMDFDIKRKIPIPPTDEEKHVLILMSDMVECVKKFYPSTTSISRFDVVVCYFSANNKIGIHPLFPNLIVNTSQAMDIRNYLVSYFISKYGDMAGIQNSWEEILDTSIYDANGLRLVGSHKTEVCPDCKQSGLRKRTYSQQQQQQQQQQQHDIPVCDRCNGHMKLDGGRQYMPKYYLRDGKIHEEWTRKVRRGLDIIIRDDTGKKRAVIELCSIRCPLINESSSGFAIVNEQMIRSTTITPRPQSPRESLYRQIDTEYGTYKMPEEDFKGMAKWKQKQFISPNSEIFRLLQDYIHSKSFPSYWRNLHIHNIFTNSKQSFYIMNIRGEGQRYCLNNRNGNHKSNSIYFYITSEGMYQRCFCSCQTTENRKHGMCENFSSDKITLPTRIENLLFPSSQSKIGHLNLTRSILDNPGEDDSTSETLLQIIVRLDEARKEYLEERQQRLKKK
jgi:hypothetical protein